MMSTTTKNRYYYLGDLLIRKEYFGTFILMRNGKRYIVDNVFFKNLKNINSGDLIDTSNKKNLEFINDLLSKKIITKNRNKKGRVKILNNKFISNDCLSYPRTVYWECINFCNYDCIHCYSSSGGNNKDDYMPFSIVKRILEEFDRYGLEFLSIGGGEPLLYPDIYKVIKYCSNLKIAVEITTNGSLLNQDSIKRLKKAGLKFIQVSLDGSNKKTYEQIRKNGNFNHVVNAMAKVSKNFTLSVCTVINKLNKDEIIEILKIAKRVGAKHYRILPQMDAGRGANISRLRLRKRELKKIYFTISRYKKSERAINIQFNENLISPKEKNIFWMPVNHFGCPAGRTTCSINTKGNVYPCSFMANDELICGNIVKDSLLNIWKKSKVLENLRNLNKIYGKCNRCKYLSECRGGCRAAAYLKYGKINASDPLCSVS